MEITLQEIFVVSFSIFFVIMLESMKNLAPFKTSVAFKDTRVFHRLLLSVFVLNILPVLYFTIFLLNLRYTRLDIYPIFVTFSLSLGVYSFARLYTTIIIFFKEKFYTCDELVSYCHSKRFEDLRITINRHWSQEFFAFCYYLLIPTFLFCLLKAQFYAIITVGVSLAVVTAFGCIFRKKYMSSLKGI